MALNFTQLGRYLAADKPHIAEELISKYQPPKETDLQKIRDFYKKFTTIHPESDKYVENAQRRRIFIAAMFHLYQPDVYLIKKIHVKPGLGKAISECINTSKAHISIMVRQVVMRERVYDDFASKVKDALGRL